MGDSTILAGTVTEAKNGTVVVATSVGAISLTGASSGAKVALAIHPKHIVLGQPQGDVALGVSVVRGGHFPSFGRCATAKLIDDYLARKRQAGCHLSRGH